jgi:Fe-S-cluster-containing hydrogenase component 2
VAEAVRLKPAQIRCDKKKCTNCMSGEAVCSERRWGMSAPSRARPRINVDVLSGEYAAEYCLKCGNDQCAPAHPEEAIEFGNQLRGWPVDDVLCTGLGECIEPCPFDAIGLDQITGLAEERDPCMGKIWCVEICPPVALLVKGRDEEAGNGK